MAVDYALTLDPLKIADIPSEPYLIQLGKTLLETTASWKQGKSFHNNTVKTYSRPKGRQDGAPWHCRVSEHTAEDATFDEFWNKLAIDKPENEMCYVPEIKKVTLLKQFSPTQRLWSMYYEFKPTVSRVYTILQTTCLEETSPRTGTIISIPIDITGPDDKDLFAMEQPGVRARYVSVERLMEDSNGTVEWRLAVSMNMGGMIPMFIVESSMDQTISLDVPYFLKTFYGDRQTKS